MISHEYVFHPDKVFCFLARHCVVCLPDSVLCCLPDNVLCVCQISRCMFGGQCVVCMPDNVLCVCPTVFYVWQTMCLLARHCIVHLPDSALYVWQSVCLLESVFYVCHIMEFCKTVCCMFGRQYDLLLPDFARQHGVYLPFCFMFCQTVCFVFCQTMR